jgi:hypothetical protein
MTATAFTLVAFRVGKFMLPLLGLVGVGALIAAALSNRTPEEYRPAVFIGAAVVVIGLIVLALALAAVGMGRLP